MNDGLSEELKRAEAGCRALMTSRQTLLLSTVTADNLPEISYAPYLQDVGGNFIILVSELASHTYNLLQQGRASVMFIRPEAECRNPFARERVTFQCRVREISPGEPDHEKQLMQLAMRFGETIALLRTLPDFHLLSLTPTSGRYVAGFGKAFDLLLPEGRLKPVGGPSEG